jgi:predicted RNA-binding protein with TRAM domain
MLRFERRGFKKFGPRVDLPKPIKVGEEYDVEINEVGSKGDGIARIKNFVVFVSNTKKGEKAHIKIKEVRNRFAIGEKVSKAEAEEPEEETEEPEEVPEETEEETE